VAPAGEQPAQFGVAQVLHARLVSLALQRQGLVEDETAGTGKAAHVAPLLPAGHERILESLQPLHTQY
jgi:hypothetical protein